MEQTKHSIPVKRRIYSFPMEGESRAEAICRTFRQYTLVDWTLYNKVSLRIVSSIEHPLLMGELNQLISVSQAFMDSAKVELSQESQTGDEQRLLLIIQAYKDEYESMD